MEWGVKLLADLQRMREIGFYIRGDLFRGVSASGDPVRSMVSFVRHVL